MQLFSNESEEVTEEKESEVSKVKTAGMKEVKEDRDAEDSNSRRRVESTYYRNMDHVHPLEKFTQ